MSTIRAFMPLLFPVVLSCGNQDPSAVPEPAAVPVGFVQEFPVDTISFSIAEKDGRLSGTFTNRRTDPIEFTRNPGSAVENFDLEIICMASGDTLSFSDFALRFDPQRSPNTRMYQYLNEVLGPGRSVPLFSLYLKDLEKLNWNNRIPESGSRWVRQNRFTPGRYRIRGIWASGGICTSNTLTVYLL